MSLPETTQNNRLILSELKGVSKSFQQGSKTLSILEHIDLKISDNELIAILGPSGCGKSLLLRILCGLIPPTQGKVLYRGEVLNGLNPGVAMVFQNFALYPWLNIEENIALGLEALPLSPSEKKQRIEKIISRVGLGGFEEAYPKELSSGMKQRVGIARALAMEPDLLCMDDPFSGLDVLSGENLRQEIIELWQEAQMKTSTILLVTHDITEAILMATRIIVLDSNPGHIREVIINSLPYPRNARSFEFQQLADRIHDSISNVLIPDEAPQESSKYNRRGSRQKLEPLPHVDVEEIIGLLEAILARSNQVDLFDFAEEVDQAFSQVLLIAKAAELLNLAETPKHEVKLSLLGKIFVEADHDLRQKIFREQITKLVIFEYIVQLLKKSEDHQIDEERLEEELALKIPNENPLIIFETLINWGRYAGILDYDTKSRRLYLEIEEDLTNTPDSSPS